MAYYFDLLWDEVTGIQGYNVHSGPDYGLPIDVQDVGNVTAAQISTTKWSGPGYAQVCGYIYVETDEGEIKFEGPRTEPIPVIAASGTDPLPDPIIRDSWVTLYF